MLYSFSVPWCVVSVAREAVTVWFQELREEALMLGLELRLTMTRVTLPSVVL